jgi:cytidylate kinase
LSTGAFYRGLALAAAREGTSLADESALAQLAGADFWSVAMAPEKTIVLYRGQDVSDEVAREEIGSIASQVSSFPLVRRALLKAQRNCAIGIPGLVAEGRDCGTVVFPAAQVKIFLTARPEDRAARRARDEGKSIDETHEAQQARDAQDASRKVAPMQAPPDSRLVDASALSFAEVVAVVEGLVRKAQAPGG